MSYKIQNYRIRKIDEENRTVTFDPSIHGKITGSRFYAVLGSDPYNSEFYAACLISKIYSEYEPTKYTVAGDIIEPIIRSYVREHGIDLLEGPMKLSSVDKVGVEEPVSKDDCGYDHFKMNPVFGGLVDGYIRVNGKRRAILEIKTASDRSKWTDSEGNISKVPENYILQASLYAELSDLDEIIFAVGFLEEDDYDEPGSWEPKDGNFFIVHMVKKDISEEMTQARSWFNKYILSGVTPKWTDRDIKIIDRLQSRTVDFMPGDLTELIRKYSVSRDASLEPTIKEGMSKLMGSCKVITYEQNGLTFRLSKDGDNLDMMISEK